MIQLLILLLLVHLTTTSSSLLQAQQNLQILRSQSHDLLTSNYNTWIKISASRRFLERSDFDGFDNFMLHAHHHHPPSPRAQHHQRCLFSLPFSVDGVLYHVDIDGNRPDVNQVSIKIQNQFPSVDKLQSVLFVRITEMLREKARECAGDGASNEGYCVCMYSHISPRVMLLQPMVIGMCPSLSTTADQVDIPNILSNKESALLIDWAIQQKAIKAVNTHGEQSGGELDSVDGLPAFTYDLDQSGAAPFHVLSDILGVSRTALKRRWKPIVLNHFKKLPVSFGDVRMEKESQWFDKMFSSVSRNDVYVFVREYSAVGRPTLQWHRDACSYSINVSLNSDSDYEGGELGMWMDSKVMISKGRAQVGHGVGFGPTVAHSVSRVTRGTRWSLVMFFDKRKDVEYPGCFVDFQMKIRSEQK